jgi:hypothetical protein
VFYTTGYLGVEQKELDKYVAEMKLKNSTNGRDYYDKPPNHYVGKDCKLCAHHKTKFECYRHCGPGEPAWTSKTCDNCGFTACLIGRKGHVCEDWKVEGGINMKTCNCDVIAT